MDELITYVEPIYAQDYSVQKDWHFHYDVKQIALSYKIEKSSERVSWLNEF